MRLINFLNEKKSASEKDIDVIKENCSEILDFYKKNNFEKLLYRGIDINDAFFYRIAPKRRQPVDSYKEWHDELNKGFKSVFGKNLRSESVFCVGSRSASNGYGYEFIIFPTNGFEVYWSPKISDLFNFSSISFFADFFDEKSFCFYTLKKIFSRENLYSADFRFKNYEDFLLSIFSLEEIKKYDENIKQKKPLTEYSKWCINKIYEKYPGCFNDFIKKNWVKGKLEKAIKSTNEIMLTCKGYYGISWDEWTSKDLHEYFE